MYYASVYFLPRPGRLCFNAQQKNKVGKSQKGTPDEKMRPYLSVDHSALFRTSYSSYYGRKIAESTFFFTFNTAASQLRRWGKMEAEKVPCGRLTKLFDNIYSYRAHSIFLSCYILLFFYPRSQQQLWVSLSVYKKGTAGSHPQIAVSKDCEFACPRSNDSSKSN